MASARKDNSIIRFGARGLRLSVAVVVAVLSALGAGGAPVALAAGADNIGSATDISASLPIVNDATSNTTATRDLGELGKCGAFPPSPSMANTRSLWYRYTAGSSGWFTVHTRGSTYDTVLEVYTSTVPSPAASDLISVACNDDIDAKTPVPQSQVMMPVTAATTYYIAIRSYGISAAVGTALFSASFAAQQHLYVSSTGDDSNIGSADAPFRTIQRAVDVAATNGDGVIHVLDTGPYDATTINKSLTLTSTVAATAPGFTLTNGAVLGSGTGGITAPTVSVDQLGAPGTKIQDGILLASAGGTVNVAAGTYSESVAIDKSLTLQGGSGAIVQAAGGTALQITAGAVTVNDFNIQGSTTGVSITGGSGHVLFHNNITGNTTGVNNASGTAVTATSNYWGSSTGPTHSSNTGGAGNSVSDNVTFTPWCTVATPTCTPLAAIPTQLVFITQPSNSSAGVLFPTQPVLRAEDASGNLGINFNRAVTMTIGANPGGGALSGTNPISGVTGIITFTNLFINNPGVGYTLVASAAGLSSATSSPFTIYNNAPSAVDDNVSTSEDTSLTFDPRANNGNGPDTDPDPGDTLTIIAVGTPSNGVASFTATSVTFTPTVNFNGTSVFTYTITDDYGFLTDTATVTVTIAPVNDGPAAVNDTATTNEDTPVTISVLANDVDVDGPSLTVSAVGTPGNGAASIVGADVVYTPTLNFNGTDVFTYTVTDGSLSDTATVTVTVNAVNDAPTISDIADQSTPEDTAVGPLGFTVGDVETAAGSLSVSGASSNPTLVPNPNIVFGGGGSSRTVTVTPAADQFGTVVITVTVSDGGLSASDAFTLTITSVNDPFTAVDDSTTILEDSGANTISALANDGAANVDVGEPLTITTAGLAANGTVITGTTVVTYTPSADFFGTDTFSYTVTDGGYTATALITVTVTPVNDPPSLVKGPDLSVPEDSGAQTYLNWATSISRGAPNESGQTLTLVVTNTNNSLFSVQPALNSANGALTFTPAPNAFGSVTVFATLTDNGGTANGGQDTSTPQSFIITVTPVNDPLTANNDTASVLSNSGPNPINVLANDTSAPDIGETLVITAVTQGVNGTVVITGGGTGLTYTPNLGFTGVDAFTYTISDGNGSTATATATVTVATPNSVVYLPLVMNNVAPLPDLVASFSLNPANPTAGQAVMVTVVITNRGTAGAGPFWADFYINPSVPPTGPNVPWNVVSIYGIAWYVPTSLGAGQSLTLTSISGGYCAPPTPSGSTPGAYCNWNTSWPGAFASGAKDLYLFVDSWNPSVATGAVTESDETNNRAERHFLSPLAGAADFDIQMMDVRRPEDLPERPSP